MPILVLVAGQLQRPTSRAKKKMKRREVNFDMFDTTIVWFVDKLYIRFVSIAIYSLWMVYYKYKEKQTNQIKQTNKRTYIIYTKW